MIVIDPMLATGGSLVHTVELLVERGAPTPITVVCALCAPEGIARLREAGLSLHVVTAAVDDHLNDRRSSSPASATPATASSVRPIAASSTSIMTGMSTEAAPADRATGERLGVRWGLAGGIALASIDEVREVTRYAVDAGFDSLWISHANAVDPIVALAATADESAGLAEVGTSVVPLYGRHPIGLAQLARTAQSALGGRFTLGIGAASTGAVATSMGLPWDRPLRYTREFIDGLQPLLAGQVADVDGEQVTTHAELNIAAPDTPILLAALGPEDARARRPAGRRAPASGSAARAPSPPTSPRGSAPPPPKRAGRSRGSWP